MTQIGKNGEWKNEQGAHDLAANFAHGQTDEDGAPSKKEPCLGVIPGHVENIILPEILRQMNKQGNRHGLYLYP